MYLFNSAPMSHENQHYILCPDHEGTMRAETVYATSPEAAVELVQGLYKVGDFGEPVPDADVSAIRLATGAELPWNNPTNAVTVVGDNVVAMSVPEARDMYESYLNKDSAKARPATPAERESYFRREALRQDAEDAEQFDYGFNVLYKAELENGL